MTSENDNIKHYTAEDISRYWEGKLSQQEMHAMEKAAMDDPFLADAMEGYAGFQATDITRDMQHLQQRLQERVSGAKVRPLKRNNWWRIAAAFILLCGAGILTYQLFLRTGETDNNISALQKTGESETAKNKQADSFNAAKPGDAVLTMKDSATVNFSAATATDTTASFKRSVYAKPLGSTDQYASSGAEAKAYPDLSRYRNQDTVSQPVVAFKKELEKAGTDTLFIASNDADREALKRPARIDGITNQTPNPQNNVSGYVTTHNNFVGRVLDRRNNAIPNASVRLHNSNMATVTNNDGTFNIRSYDSVMDVSVTSVGYEPRQFTLRGNQPQDVVLDENSKKLNEVVVTKSSGAKDKKYSPSTPDLKAPDLKVYVMEAEPVIGWDDYNKYLNESKRADDSYKLVKGDVVVSFWVGKNGKLSSFNIEQSLHKTADAEAIRLIKDGPAWKLLKGKRTKARVIVNF